ncbi:MAG: hypothetical protein KJ607_03495, partial [Bacteroidetes bacterium]|nr:hypothetical protein [Bacteroidota bacterium]
MKNYAKLTAALIVLSISSTFSQQNAVDIMKSDLSYWEKVAAIEGNYDQIKSNTDAAILKRYHRWRNYMDMRIGEDGTMKDDLRSYLAAIRNTSGGTRSGFLDYQQLGPVESECNAKNYQGRVDYMTIGYNPNRVYIGTSGGLYKTDDITSAEPEWTCINMDFRGLNVLDMAIEPGGSDQTIYVTATNYGGWAKYCLTAYYGLGVLMTTDGGTSWSTIMDIEAMDFEPIWAVELHPDDPSIVYALSSYKLYWGQYNEFTDEWEWNSIYLPVTDDDVIYKGFEFNDDNHDEIIAFGSNCISKLTYSTLNATWTGVDIAQDFTNMGLSDQRLVADYNPVNHKWYVMDWQGKLATYADNTATHITNLNITPPGTPYVLSIKVSPEGNIYAGAINLCRLNIADNTRQYISDDHYDIRAYAFPNNTDDVAYIGNDGGIIQWDYHSTSFVKKNGNGSFYQFTNIGIGEGTDRITAGAIDVGSWLRADDGTWDHVTSGDGGNAAVTGDGLIYSTTQIWHDTYICFKSSDAIKSSTYSAAISPTIQHPEMNNTLLFAKGWGANGDVLAKCTYTGGVFSTAPIDDLAWGTIYGGDISKANTDRIMISRFYRVPAPLTGTFGNIRYSMNGGNCPADYQHISEYDIHDDLGIPLTSPQESILDGWPISDVEFHPTDEDIVWVVFSGFGQYKVLEGEYQATDNRWHWTDLTYNLISSYGNNVVNCITYDENN